MTTHPLLSQNLVSEHHIVYILLVCCMVQDFASASDMTTSTCPALVHVSLTLSVLHIIPLNDVDFNFKHAQATHLFTVSSPHAQLAPRGQESFQLFPVHSSLCRAVKMLFEVSRIFSGCTTSIQINCSSAHSFRHAKRLAVGQVTNQNKTQNPAE